MARYDTAIDLANPNSSHTQIVELVGPQKTVLDVGCATGYLARQLAVRDCEVYGVDNDPEAAERARKYLVELVIADLDQSPLTDHFAPNKFDAVVFGDVLEHLVHPERVLADAVTLLKEDGCIIVSIPNVAHGSVRLALLQGRWEYTDTGLLDRTHLRFFTRSSVIALLQGAGLAVEDVRSTVFDPLAADVQVDASELPPAIIEWVRDQPDALNYQFIALARRSVTAREPYVTPEVEPAFPESQVRRDDEYTAQVRQQVEQVQQQLEREQDLRHRLLTHRDHVVGLEASVGAAQSRQALAERRAVKSEKQLERVRQRLNQKTLRVKRAEAKVARLEGRLRRSRRHAAAERQALMESGTWRAGRALTWPMRLVRPRRG